MDQYAVIGHPIKHSLSPQIHTAFAKQTEQDLTYSTIDAEPDQFKAAIQQFRDAGGRGLNVTLPFKEDAFQLANAHSDLATHCEAANTLAFKEDGVIYADNTDGTGLIQDLTNNHHVSLRQKHILLLGAGGAARGIAAALLKMAPEALIIANRTGSKAVALAEHFDYPGELKGVGLIAIEPYPFDVIINATSAGLTGSPLELPTEIIGEKTICYDVMYGAQNTPFLDWAKAQGATQYFDGLGMLVEQAAAAFYLWRHVYPETKPVIDLLRQQLS